MSFFSWLYCAVLWLYFGIAQSNLRRLLLSVRAGSSNLAKSVYAIEIYQHENLQTTSYTCKLSKNHWFLLTKSLSMYEKWRQMYVIRHKTKPVFHIILHWTSFLIQTASLFVHGETFNQKESMLFRQIVSIAGCVRSFILVHWTLVFLATPARTTNKTRLNVQLSMGIHKLITEHFWWGIEWDHTALKFPNHAKELRQNGIIFLTLSPPKCEVLVQ